MLVLGRGVVGLKVTRSGSLTSSSLVNFSRRVGIGKDVTATAAGTARASSIGVGTGTSARLPKARPFSNNRIIGEGGGGGRRSGDFRVLFLGSDSFAIASLEAVLSHFPPSSVTVVVSNEKNLVGRFARRKDLRLLLWDAFKGSAGDGRTAGTQAEFNLGVVASFGYLIPERVIRKCQMCVLSLKLSLKLNIKIEISTYSLAIYV